MPRTLPLAGLLLLAAAAVARQPAPGSAEKLPPPADYAACRVTRKVDFLREAGGTEATEAAVARGLAWLAKKQQPDGRWLVDGTADRDTVAATSLALMAFLGAGHSPRTNPDGAGASKYADAVRKGLRYVIANQNPKGQFKAGSLYGQAMATLALCEALALTKDAATLKRPAQAGVDFLVSAQHQAGGWRYTPGQAGDTSVTGWVVQAFRAAKHAGLRVPEKTLDGATAYLDTVCNPDASRYGYVERKPTRSMTAAGLACRLALGWTPDEKGFQDGAEFLARTGPKSTDDFYAGYYTTIVLRSAGGKSWSDWNPVMTAWLTGSQIKRGTLEGSWDPDKTHTGHGGGRVVTTCLAVLMLESYYRHVPAEK